MTTQERLREDAREKLLDAAERKFGAADFDSVSIRDIAQEAGVNLAGIKYHFGNKEGLLEATIVRKLNRLVHFAREAALEAKDHDRLRTVLSALMDKACQDEEGPYLEVNYRAVLDRKGAKAREEFLRRNVEPLNQIFFSAAKLCKLRQEWSFLEPDELVMILVGLPKAWKLFASIFLSPKRTQGLSPGGLHKQGTQMSLRILETMCEEKL